MFILRKISDRGKGTYRNVSLGNTYMKVLKESNPKDFEKMVEVDPPCHESYGYLVGEDLEVHWLYPNQANYIMASNGETFEKLTDATEWFKKN